MEETRPMSAAEVAGMKAQEHALQASNAMLKRCAAAATATARMQCPSRTCLPPMPLPSLLACITSWLRPLPAGD